MRVLGLDIGGTSVRAVVTDAAGAALGRGRAGGGSVLSSEGSPTEHVRSAVTAALAGLGGVDAVGVGAAGAHRLRDRVTAMVADALAGLHLPPPLVVEDTAIAFHAASPDADGVLVLAGTGSVAVRFETWHPVARCDGMGWLLGDEGSGAWVGRRVLRAAAADLDARGPATALTGRVLDALGLGVAGGDGERDRDVRGDLVAATAGLPPAGWARFAPAAVDLDGTDPVVTALLDEAAGRLRALGEAVGATPGGPVVLAGGLLAGGGVRRRLDGWFTTTHATHPVVGACTLAASAVGGRVDRDALTAALAGG